MYTTMIDLPGDGQQREGEQRAHDTEDEDGEEVVEERLTWVIFGVGCVLFVIVGFRSSSSVRPSVHLSWIDFLSPAVGARRPAAG